MQTRPKDSRRRSRFCGRSCWSSRSGDSGGTTCSPERPSGPRRVAAERIALVSAAAPHGAANFRRLEEAGFDLVDRSELDMSKDEDALAAALAGVWGTVAGGELYSRRLPE